MSPQHLWRIVHSEASLGWGGQEPRVLAELKGFQQRGAWVALFAPEHSEVFQRAREVGVEVQILDARKSHYPITALRLKWRFRYHEVQAVSSNASPMCLSLTKSSRSGSGLGWTRGGMARG
jgi:hypothetical protein